MMKKWIKSKPKRWAKVSKGIVSPIDKYLDKRETMIVFVYDTECLKEEADDPVNAVLYFHPSWVSDTQKVALCGQLMGTSFFLKDCFFKPRILALQNGKFILKEFGRFILAIGTDRNISDFLLEHRAELLASLVRLFHRDLQSIYDQFFLSGQYKNLSEKLYHIFETYLPILQYKGNIFLSTPKLRIPKTASNIFLDAIQTLQCCQQTKGVLGGAILYHNKVVSSQLSDHITKQLVLTDPLHIRTTAEQLNAVDFHIPNGVQMIVVYIETEQYRKLAADAQRAQNLQTQQLSQGSGGGLPFQYAKRKMKRDKSLIFTNIPEEGSTTAAADQIDGIKEDGILTSTLPSMGRPKPLSRPTHLPLRFKNMTSKELPESGIASINFDENDSYPEFIGRTSVCSTPLTENKVLQVANIMSICANPEDENNSNGKKVSINQTENNQRNSMKIDFDKFFQNFISNPNKMERRNSFTDLQDSIKKISKKLSLKSKFSNGIKTDVNRNGSCAGTDTPGDFIENCVEGNEDLDDDDNSDNFDEHNKTSRTITDPTYPVFNSNGQPISRSLFQEFLERYYKLWEANGGDNDKQGTEIAQLIDEFKEFDSELKKLNDTLVTKDCNKSTTAAAFKADSNLNIEEIVSVEKTRTAKTPLDKKLLSLPLKPLTDATPGDAAGAALSHGGGNGINQRKPSGGIPLTPLMAKLSVLALNEDRSTSGFCSWDTTPGGVEIQTPFDSSKVFGRRRSSLKCEDAVDAMATAALSANTATSSTDDLQRVELYICGQQNMTLLLLLEQGSGSKHQIVQNMFDICVAKFPHMESHLNQLLNVNVEGDKNDCGYSFMCIDSKWDALQRNGPWNPVELNTLETMHRDLQLSDSEVTDLILRPNDTVFYGYKSGRTEFFYKESVRQATGIPPPSDPMGNVAMRAKTRLERDHSYVLF